MKPIGVIIARFQCPYLHPGHRALIESVMKNHNKTVIVLGVSPVKGSRKNPLDFPTREKMIKLAYPELIILPISDHPMDSRWSQNLDTLLTSTFPGSGFKLYGSRDSFIPHYNGKLETVELPETSVQNSTLIRERVSDLVLNTEEFRTGVIYAFANTFDKVYPTVDIAVFRHNKTELLLGKKDIDNKWRLPGGFADPTDLSYEDTAIRELKEECGPIITSGMHYEKSFRVNDWRYRPETDKIITCLFSTEHLSGTAQGSDDISEVNWFLLDQVIGMVSRNETAKDHEPQLMFLLEKYLNKEI
ncbi:MAG: NUDIX domain-containing protein [Cyclobacteriaceae bacterium]|nr:NUDIX domain-containing protein [Cyclobacteriaceae bacterium]